MNAGEIDMTSSDIDLTTSDGVNIKATYYKGNSSNGIVLLHMLSRTRKDWEPFANELQGKGYNVISIDLRGHGQSNLNWQSFNSRDFNNMIEDVRASKDFLNAKGARVIAIIGASVGANVALNYAATDSEIKTVIMLSPGLDYRGVKTNETIRNFNGPTLLVTSSEDLYSVESASKLHKLSVSKDTKLETYDNAGHGTEMLKEKKLPTLIFNWLSKHLK